MTTLRTDIVRALAGLLPAQKKEPWEMTYQEFAENVDARKELYSGGRGEKRWTVKYKHENWYQASFPTMHSARSKQQAIERAYFMVVLTASNNKKNVPEYAFQKAVSLSNEAHLRRNKYHAKLEANYDKKHKQQQ